jgi:ribosomal-protein-alanine N-acetyltransferase
LGAVVVKIPTLETKRLILREWRESDFPAYAEFRNDPVVAKYNGPVSPGEAWRTALYNIGHWQVRGFGQFQIELKANQQPIGTCGPYYPLEWPEPEIAWNVYADYRRQGFASEAARAALEFAYSTLGWPTAISVIADDNVASFGVAKKLGASPEKSITIKGIGCTLFRHLSPPTFQKHSKENMTCH